jgi:ABC-2 type transport system permease protein
MSAAKTLIIIEREYLTRVRNKTFILSTFLFPIMMIVFIFGSVFFAVQSVEMRKVAVVNDPGFFAKYMRSDSSRVVFDYQSGIDSTNYAEKGFDGILYLPEGTTSRDYLLQSKKQFGLNANEYVERQINKAIENHLLEEQGIEQQMLDSIAAASKGHARLNNQVSDEKGRSQHANAGLAHGIGFGSGILIYITMFIFGSMVMRGVVEEKTNRIAEVIVSSCKPFELMMGKIIGIAGVGLTQFLLWIGLIFILMTSIQFFVPAEVMELARQNPGQLQSGREADIAMKIMETKTEILEGANWALILSLFLFYFLGGYLFYASLFDAIGSVVNA